MHLSQEKGKIQSSRYRESPCLVFNRQRHKAEADMLDNDISPEQRKCLETAFEAADKNGDGILSADEYYEIFQTHGLSIGKKNEKHNYELEAFNFLFLVVYAYFKNASLEKNAKRDAVALFVKKVLFILILPTYPMKPSTTYYLNQT